MVISAPHAGKIEQIKVSEGVNLFFRNKMLTGACRIRLMDRT